MPLINRFARLLSADLNALLDRIEEPALLARQALREMEQELVAMSERARALGAADDALAREDAHLADALARLDAELDTCLAACEDTLARDLVRRKLEHARRRENIAHTREHHAAARAELADSEAATRAELALLRARLAELSEAATRPAPSATHPVRPATPSAAEIDIALLHEKQQRRHYREQPA